jgi:hypothetical protein
VATALRKRLETVLSDEPWTAIKKQAGHFTRPPIADVRAIIVHETSEMATRARGAGMFSGQFGPHKQGLTTQLYVAGDGTVLLGMELPRKTNHATFINSWAIGSETGHPWGNYKGNSHLGPWCSTRETGTKKQKGQLVALFRKPGNGWLPLRGEDRLDHPEDNDLPGEKFYLRHSAQAEVVVSRWTTTSYDGPWRQPQRVPEAPFSEWQYRSWALLARYLAERFLVPRNFPLLPHKLRSSGYGTDAGLHSMAHDSVSFRAIVRADEILFRKVAELPGLSQEDFDTDLQTAYDDAVRDVQDPNGDPGDTFEVNDIWTAFFSHYRGIHGHGFSGDPNQNKDHDCPGPLFDWHRFAREVWDWWWRPFDFSLTDGDVRPYRPITRNGDTPLTEHYFHTSGPDYLARDVHGIHGAKSSPRTYRTAKGTRVYALANGELVAARFPVTTSGVSLAFSIVKHEVYHQLDELQMIPSLMREAAGLEPLPAVLPNRLSYDIPPSTVYTLYMHLSRAGMNFDDIADGNPDWLNRLLVRKKECALGLAFHSLQGDIFEVDPRWLTPPPGTPQRPTVLQAWRADESYLSSFVDGLRTGRLVLASQDAFATPIRVVLGDYMGNVGVIRRTASDEQYGVRVEVFSSRRISTEFPLTTSDPPEAGWAPKAIGAGSPAVSYPSEWARTPAGEERATLLAAGVAEDQLGEVSWWNDFQLSTTIGRTFADDARLPERPVHYDPDGFMAWLNRRTWRSEWSKYRLADPVEAPDPRPRTL